MWDAGATLTHTHSADSRPVNNPTFMNMKICDTTGTCKLVSDDKTVDIEIIDVLTDTDVFDTNRDPTVFKVGHDVFQAASALDALTWTTQLQNAHEENIIKACDRVIVKMSQSPNTAAGKVAQLFNELKLLKPLKQPGWQRSASVSRMRTAANEVLRLCRADLHSI